MPNVRDDRETPSQWDGMAGVVNVIWGKWEQKYFSENPKKRLDSPVNKPPDGQIT
jgi:hypothetical protein